MTNPATETKSIGLPADAQAVKFFAAPLRKLYLDVTTLYRLPGPAKNSPALTRTATNHTGWPLGFIILTTEPCNISGPKNMKTIWPSY